MVEKIDLLNFVNFRHDTQVYLSLCLFCDFNRKDFEGFKTKNIVATRNRFLTTIFNWSKNVASAFKDAKRFATLTNLCKCDLIPKDFRNFQKLDCDQF